MIDLGTKSMHKLLWNQYLCKKIFNSDFQLYIKLSWKTTLARVIFLCIYSVSHCLKISCNFNALQPFRKVQFSTRMVLNWPCLKPMQQGNFWYNNYDENQYKISYILKIIHFFLTKYEDSLKGIHNVNKCALEKWWKPPRSGCKSLFCTPAFAAAAAI